jgi:hypothetical protein
MTHRRSSSRLSSGLVRLVSTLGLTSAASAATTLAGGNVGGQTWTFSGSPYLINGDVTVQAGTTLTIQAGVQIQFAGTDGQHDGLDPSRVELGRCPSTPSARRYRRPEGRYSSFASIRRFFWRPSSVSLGAMGCSSPKPTASSRFLSMPFETR